MNCIEKGLTRRLRFPIKGQCSVEDLFVIDLRDLDEFAMVLDKELDKKTRSFISKKKTKNPDKKLMLDIVKRVIEVRMDEQERAEQAHDNKALREKAARILAIRKDSAMEELSDDELKKIAKG